jgi:hypothetical protein
MEWNVSDIPKSIMAKKTPREHHLPNNPSQNLFKKPSLEKKK